MQRYRLRTPQQKPEPQPLAAAEIPNYLSDDMKPRDVVFVLQHFPFRQRRNADQRIAIEIDKGIRDYLIHHIRSR